MDIICLDAEFADNEEILELSVFATRGQEIYHSYYKPEKIHSWRTDIHNITPEKVVQEKSFKSAIAKVQDLIDNADALTGFAVGNDLRVLALAGITGLEAKRVIDVREMYWYLKGRPMGMSPFEIPSLLACANDLGLGFSEKEAHSASADTEATLRCFNILFDEFVANEGGGTGDSDVVGMFIGRIESAKASFIEESAKGFIRIYRCGNDYKVKTEHKKVAGGRGMVAEVAVADRFKAEYDIRKMLKKREVAGVHDVYKIKQRTIEELKQYRNVYDAEQSAWCKKIVRNLSRLSL